MNEEQHLINEETYITPLNEILNNAAPHGTSDTQSTKQSLDNLFPEQHYEDKQLKKAKEVLGMLSTEFTEVQLRDITTEIQFLVGCWMDDFEKMIFEGKTLQELLHEKGGL